MTFRSRGRFKGIGLYKPIAVENSRVILENVLRGDRKWYGVYVEDRPFRRDYETLFINSKGEKEYALDVEYLPETFDLDGVRPVFLGELNILKLYNALVPYKEREMLDRDKFLAGDFSQLTQHFDNLVCGVIYKSTMYAFMSHHQFLNLVEGRPLEPYLYEYLKKLGLHPAQDFIIQ